MVVDVLLAVCRPHTVCTEVNTAALTPVLSRQGGVPADLRVGPDAEGGRWHARVRHTRGRSGHGHPGAVRGHDELVR